MNFSDLNLKDRLDEEMKERLVWTLVSGIVAGAAAILTERLTHHLWARAFRRDPPKRVAPVAFLGERLGAGAVNQIATWVAAFR